MSKHTEGPWIVEEDVVGRPPMHSDLRVIAPGTTKDHVRPIARLELQGMESEANAKLIAAAPRLLDALKRLEHASSFAAIEDPREHKMVGEALREARAALEAAGVE